MEVHVESKTDVSKEVEIVATPEELVPHFDKAYQEYRKKIEIRGFRKGKAPLDIVKKMYGELIENEALNEIANTLFRKAVQEKELKPIGEPVLVDIEYKHGENFRCKVRYDIRPAIVLQEYKGIPVEKVIHTITDAEIEKEIGRLLQAHAVLEEVETASDAEHIVTATLQDLDESGAPMAGRRSEHVRLYLGDEKLEQQFKDVLKNAKKDGEYSVEFTHTHGDHDHTIKTHILVTKVEKINLPALDDAFVAKVTKDKFKSVDELRKNIHTDVVAYWKEKMERQVINSLTAEIIKRHEFQIPESLTRSVLDGLLEEMKNEYPKKQLPPDFDYEKFNEQNRPYAVYQAKWALLREELIQAEKIDITDADMEQLAETEAAKIGIAKDRLIQYYKSSEQIKDRLTGDKLLKVLVDSAKITEVPEKV